MKKALTAALISLSLTQLVSGCAALAVGGIAAGGMSALDRRILLPNWWVVLKWSAWVWRALP